MRKFKEGDIISPNRERGEASYIFPDDTYTVVEVIEVEPRYRRSVGHRQHLRIGGDADLISAWWFDTNKFSNEEYSE